MKFQKISIVFFLFTFSLISAQIQDPLAIYRKEKEKVNNLVHTKLAVNFNFKDKELNGEAWITLAPHFYPTNKVVLDAKAMLIHSITLDNKKLEYHYDDFEISIDLPKTYKKGEEYYLLGLKIEPNHKGINEYLGELYVITERIDLAKKRLEVLKDCNCEEYNDLKEIIGGTKKSKY